MTTGGNNSVETIRQRERKLVTISELNLRGRHNDNWGK